MHVHVWHQGNETVIRFETEIVLVEVNGMSRQEVKRALGIVHEHQSFLVEKWRQIYGDDDR